MLVALTHPSNTEDSLHLDISISTTLGISANQARRKLVRYFMDNVSMFIGPEQPMLVITDQSHFYWRFPISIRMGQLGRLGQVGQVDVDAQNGEILLDESHLKEITINANLLAKAATHSPVH
mgnify:CR=1 FL=1